MFRMPNSRMWMKAVRIHKFGDPNVLQIDDIPEYKCRHNEVKVSIKACGINHLDIWVRKGLPGIELPQIPGSDGAGKIVETGKRVQKWKVGDKVVINPGFSCGNCIWCTKGQENFCKDYGILGETCNGVQSEFFCIDENRVKRIPEQLSFTQAASMPLVFMTAWQMLMERAALQKDEWALIYGGSSGVGSAAIQIAKHAGGIVIATVGDEKKFDHAKVMGADIVINHNEENWMELVKKYTSEGMDVIFEHVGSSTWDASMKLLNKGGRVVTCGATTGYKVNIDLRHLFFKQLSILGSTMSNFGTFDLIMEKIRKKYFIPFVDSTYPFKDVSQAHRRIENREHLGKVVLKLD